MPHIVVEYSANLAAEIAPARLVEIVHRAVLADPAFEIGAVRTRAVGYEDVMIADGDPANAFIAVTIRIGPGRDAATRKRVSETVAAALMGALASAFERRGLALSVEVAELDDSAMTRKNNLHARMRAKAGGAPR
ncbi:MAG TPA: 5-carboxymethyl-2-hydroxymuconate isomerase [Roseiarcus sp.]|nr:5-carboxymethyl-2-hydroxymuconate isomerase [Roseiarcus sp.]